tara:strand:- start:6414 stop:6938 length:525 start_codon:yes stop_codon:yes gene_type:complete
MSTEVVSLSDTLPDNPLLPTDPVHDPDDEDVRSNDDDDDAGSLVDFIVEDGGEEGDGDTDDESVTSEPPKTQEEECTRDLDGIDTTNIITGKRTRHQTKFYDQEIFNTEEYRKMIMDDIPEEERHALEESSEDEDEDDDVEYEEEDGEYEEDDGDEDGGEQEVGVTPSPTPSKK